MASYAHFAVDKKYTFFYGSYIKEIISIFRIENIVDILYRWELCKHLFIFLNILLGVRWWLTSLSWNAVPKTCPRTTTCAWCATRSCWASAAACRPASRANRCLRPRRTRTRARLRRRTWPTRTRNRWCPARRTWRRCRRRTTTPAA